MNVIDRIMANRSKLVEVAAAYRVLQLKLYGSVLTRKETEQSDIDFLAIFDRSIPYDFEASLNLQQDLACCFNRKVSIVDSRRIPEVFRLTIDIDPINIMELSPSLHHHTEIERTVSHNVGSAIQRV